MGTQRMKAKPKSKPKTEQVVPPRPRRKRGSPSRLIEAASAAVEVVLPEAMDATRGPEALREYLKMKMQAGQLNRASRQEVTLVWVEQTGITPLQFLIGQMRNTKNKLVFRGWCAAEAMPYVHRKMPSMLELERIDPEGQLTEAAMRSLTDEQLETLLEISRKMAPRTLEHKA